MNGKILCKVGIILISYLLRLFWKSKKEKTVKHSKIIHKRSMDFNQWPDKYKMVQSKERLFWDTHKGR